MIFHLHKIWRYNKHPMFSNVIGTVGQYPLSISNGTICVIECIALSYANSTIGRNSAQCHKYACAYLCINEISVQLHHLVSLFNNGRHVLMSATLKPNISYTLVYSSLLSSAPLSEITIYRRLYDVCHPATGFPLPLCYESLTSIYGCSIVLRERAPMIW